MEDSPSPSPARDKEKDHHRRISGGVAPSAFRPPLNLSTSPTSLAPSESRAPSALGHSQLPTIRRPQSRLSDGRSSISTNATTSTASSIPTPVSRPATPTFLPVPTSGLYHSAIGLKRSTGPPSSPYSQPKRSSLGTSTTSTIRATSKISSPGRMRPTYAPSATKKTGDDFTDAQLKHGRARAGSSTLLFSRSGSS